ncbi:MAG: ABC transporter ATP-binding protein [Bacteroidetes bacterium]|nr:MAG: ABC transporter ATP-binding protein [Bacteroidota bacterium]
MLPLLQIKNLSIDFRLEDKTVHAVKNISLEVARGEVVAVVGESGSGKSVTSLSILQLLPSPPAVKSGGEILFSSNGKESIDLSSLNSKQIQEYRGNQVAMIFQEPMTSLNPVLTCGDQVMEAIRLHKNVSRADARRQTIDLFASVKLPNPELMLSRYPHQLSGGQKQRVMIAVAMSCQPSLLICDEPTTALDVTVQKTILQLIKELQQASNMGVIFITHDLGVVSEIADRAVVLYKGEIVEQGTVKDLFSRPQHPYTKGLLNCRPVLHRKGERLPVVEDFMFPPKTKTDENHGDSTFSPKSRSVLMEVKNLSVVFQSKKILFGKSAAFRAVDDVSFFVYKGETLGLVGESGCGKTTLGRTLLRLIEPESGQIVFDGMDLLGYRGDDLKKVRKDIQIVFQDPYSSLNPRITIGSAIEEPMKVHREENFRNRREKVSELLKKVNLPAEYYHRFPHEFSGGQRQRIVIARALALHPSFVVFDESVSALDVSVQAQVLNLINDLKREMGFTAIFISHDLSVVRYISDRILVMNRGRIEEIGDADEIYYHPRSEYTKKLISSIPGH